MALTPDEIVRRPFTPSADGYHKGEVRSFLERLGSQVRALQATQTEGGVELAELSMMINDHEPRLAQLEQQLTNALANLATLTEQTRATQQEAAAQLRLAQQLVTAGASTGSAGASEALERLVADQQAVLNQLVAEREALAAAPTPTDGPVDQPAPHAEPASSPPAVALPIADRVEPAPQVANDDVIAAADQAEAAAGQLTVSPPPAPRPTPAAPSAATTSAGATMDLFGSDLENEPLFSDSANDLLDGVLDDVMENINDEGTNQ